MNAIDRIADWYDEQPIFDRRAIPAYAAMLKVNAKLLADLGRWGRLPSISLTNPYQTSAELFAAIDAGQWSVYGRGERHPWLTATENLIFRAVHDFYGHYACRASFSLNGELRAAAQHIRTAERLGCLDAECRGAGPAIAMETVGQICYYYTHRRYAKQKLGILPAELMEGVLL